MNYVQRLKLITMTRNCKKWMFVLALAIPMGLLSGCGGDDDDDNNDDILDMGPVVTKFSFDIRFASVDPAEDQFTLINLGTDMVDVSNYVLCSRLVYTVGSAPATLDQLDVVLNDLLLEPNETVVLKGFSINDNAADFAIYLTGTTAPNGFANDEFIVDFLQWGGSFRSGQGREDEAVSAGIWESEEFLEGNGPFTSTATELNQRGSEFWEGG